MSNWMSFMILGVLSVIIGGFAVIFPEATAVGVELFVAWSLIILGIVYIIAAFRAREEGSIFWAVLLSILMIVTGILLLTKPDAGVMVLGVILAIMSIAQGCVMLIGAFTRGIGSFRWWLIIGAVASFVLAWFIFESPVSSLGLLFGIQLIINGFSTIGLSLSLKRAGALF